MFSKYSMLTLILAGIFKVLVSILLSLFLISISCGVYSKFSLIIFIVLSFIVIYLVSASKPSGRFKYISLEIPLATSFISTYLVSIDSVLSTTSFLPFIVTLS